MIFKPLLNARQPGTGQQGWYSDVIYYVTSSYLLYRPDDLGTDFSDENKKKRAIDEETQKEKKKTIIRYETSRKKENLLHRLHEKKNRQAKYCSKTRGKSCPTGYSSYGLNKWCFPNGKQYRTDVLKAKPAPSPSPSPAPQRNQHQHRPRDKNTQKGRSETNPKNATVTLLTLQEPIQD